MRWLPNLFTTLNMISGLTALFLVSVGQFVPACWLILLATLFDGLDGRIARWLGQESGFGKTFDSCSDFISFGCAPAFLFYSACGDVYRFISLVVSVLFVGSSLFRLIRFHKNHTNGGEYFEGLPITAGGGFMASLILFLSPFQSPYAICLAAMLVLAALMVSKIPYPNFKYVYLGLVPVGICLIGGALSIFGFQNQAPIIPMSIFSGYVCFGGLERWFRKRTASA